MKNDRSVYGFDFPENRSKTGAAVGAWLIAVLATATAMTAGVQPRSALLSLFVTIPSLYFVLLLSLTRRRHDRGDVVPATSTTERFTMSTIAAMESVAPPDVFVRKPAFVAEPSVFPRLSFAYHDTFRVLTYKADRSLVWHVYLAVFLVVARAADMLATFSGRLLQPEAFRAEAWQRIMYARDAARRFRSEIVTYEQSTEAEAVYLRAASQAVKQVLDSADHQPGLVRIEGANKIFYIVLTDPPQAETSSANDQLQAELFEEVAQ
jgi:hypothetical protein